MHLIGVSKLDIICHLIINEAPLIELPNQQKSVSNVFVRCTRILIHDSMHNLTDLIDKHHDSLLKYFSGICKISYITESKNSNYFFSHNCI